VKLPRQNDAVGLAARTTDVVQSGGERLVYTEKVAPLWRGTVQLTLTGQAEKVRGFEPFMSTKKKLVKVYKLVKTNTF